ncbi:DNA methyltransferase [Methanocella conradii]|uniref:DNA methyltransferase n=2 Tax=Methanocella conradii TaxID=1175444 RepID=UPI0024B39213|nr:DNA methyltransferase [Methanocella conradii]MDI6897387.1 DNA methyltransferase [Methanocella conradii]
MYESLSSLLSSDLNFHDKNSTYSSHAIHAFAAKFPPQLPRAFIESLTNPGDVVLDPMSGSGTTILEAYLLNRRGVGCDIDPLAVKMARVKTTPLEVDCFQLIPEVIRNAVNILKDEAKVNQAISSRFDRKTKEFIDYWFFPETQKELMALLLAIDNYEKGPVRELLEVIFSSIIVTKSGGVSRARDLAHSRPHLDPEKKPRNAIKAFEQRLLKFAPIIAALPVHDYPATIKQCNAKSLSIKDNSVHLVMTSPPYANAIDYMRANKFSLVWLGMSISDLGKLRSKYIGNEATGKMKMEMLPEYTESILSSLMAKDKKKEAVLRKYYMEMRDAMREMYRVLIPGHYAILVVGTSIMRGVDVKTPQCLGDIARTLGFQLETIQSRELDRDRRMMPFGNGNTHIEQRMVTEEVIILKKP